MREEDEREKQVGERPKAINHNKPRYIGRCNALLSACPLELNRAKCSNNSLHPCAPPRPLQSLFHFPLSFSLFRSRFSHIHLTGSLSLFFSCSRYCPFTPSHALLEKRQTRNTQPKCSAVTPGDNGRQNPHTPSAPRLLILYQLTRTWRYTLRCEKSLNPVISHGE